MTLFFTLSSREDQSMSVRQEQEAVLADNKQLILGLESLQNVRLETDTDVEVH